MIKLKLQAIVLVLIAFMLGCNEFIIVGILSDISRQFGEKISTVGYLVTLFALVYAVSTPVITVFISRFNRYTSLSVLMIIFIVGNTYSALAPTYFQLVISRVITALTAGVIISLAMSFATVIASVEKRAFLVAWIFSGFSIASVFGVPIGTVISAAWGWRYAFFAITIISFVSLVLMMLVLPRNVTQAKSTLVNQLTICSDPRMIVGTLLVLCSAAASYVVYTYIRPLLITVLAFPAASLSILLFVYGLTSIMSNQLSGFLAARDGLNKMPWIYMIETLMFVSLPLLLKWQWAGLVDIMLIGLVMYLLNSPIQIHFLSVAEKDYPQSLVLASSFNSIFFNFGISLGSAAGSMIIDKTTPSFLGVGAAVFSLSALGLSISLNRLR